MPDVSLEDFLTSDLIDEYDDTLSKSMFSEWLQSGGTRPGPDECIGFRQPLLLGGLDQVSNLERVLLKVYVSVCGQIAQQVASIPSDGRIGRVRAE